MAEAGNHDRARLAGLPLQLVALGRSDEQPHARGVAANRREQQRREAVAHGGRHGPGTQQGLFQVRGSSRLLGPGRVRSGARPGAKRVQGSTHLHARSVPRAGRQEQGRGPVACGEVQLFFRPRREARRPRWAAPVFDHPHSDHVIAQIKAVDHAPLHRPEDGRSAGQDRRSLQPDSPRACRCLRHLRRATNRPRVVLAWRARHSCFAESPGWPG